MSTGTHKRCRWELSAMDEFTRKEAAFLRPVIDDMIMKAFLKELGA